MHVWRHRGFGLLAGLLLVTASPDARAVAVDLELALGVDVSGSTDETEFQLMINGYAAAFRSPAVLAALDSGPNGQIAVSMYFWSAENSNGLGAVKIPFTAVSSASASAFADSIEELFEPLAELEVEEGTIVFDPPLREPYFLDLENLTVFGGTGEGSGFTAVAQAIDFGRDLLLAENGFEGLRRVLDISGDGQENVNHNPAGCRDPEACAELGNIINPLDPAAPGALIEDPEVFFAAVAQARAVALAAGLTAINGLPIETDIVDLNAQFYVPYVIGGEGAFSLPAADYDDFGTAVANKLAAEIVPEPSAGALLLLGLVSVSFARARRGRGPSARGSA
jgi:hypothetical protein